MVSHTHTLKVNDLVIPTHGTAVFIVEALIPGIAVASVRAVNTAVTALVHTDTITYVGHLPDNN